MKRSARFAPGLVALAALLLAPLAEASLTRVAPPDIDWPALTLASRVSEPVEFSLFEGNEITRAAAATGSAESFHPLAAGSFLSEDARVELAPALETSYPKTRVWGLRLFSQKVYLVERELSLEVHWGCADFSCGLTSGTVAWLSQDPLGDRDSVNLYGFVGMRPHERKDPLGLAGDEPGFLNRFVDWIGSTPPAQFVRKVAGWGHEASENTGTAVEQKYRQALRTGAVDPANDEMLREAGYDPTTVIGVASGLQPSRAGKEASKNKTSDVVQRGTSIATEQLLYFGVASVVGKAANVRANLARSTDFEARAQAAVQELGETIIPSQFKRGAADRGFDFLSFSGRGAEAKLFINEAKDEAGRVGSRRFTAFGSKRMKTWQENLNVARQRIEDAGLDLETRNALQRQLDEQRARIRMIGNPSTKFDPTILDEIGKRTGFMVGEGPKVQ